MTTSSSATRNSDHAYQAEVLPGVSRTFALTIPELPDALRGVVSNAYLLCRITDTIEDEPALTAAQKEVFWRRFVHVVEGRDDAADFAQELCASLSSSTTACEQRSPHSADGAPFEQARERITRKRSRICGTRADGHAG